jgi:hypothetical protein
MFCERVETAAVAQCDHRGARELGAQDHIDN